MIRKIPENTSEGIRFLFCKVHKFENQLILTISDTVIIVIIVVIIVIIIVVVLTITIITKI